MLWLKNKLILTFSAILIAWLAVVAVIIIPSIKEISTISQEIEQQREELEAKFLAGKSLKNTTLSLEEVEKKLPLLQTIFVEENKELELITALEKAAAVNSLQPKINLENSVQNLSANIKALPVSIYLSGSYPNFVKYLSEVQKLNYYFNINSITIGRDQNKNAITAFLKGNIYWKTADNNLIK